MWNNISQSTFQKNKHKEIDMKNGYRKPNTGPLIQDAANSVDLSFEELSHLSNETQHIFLSWLTFREFL